MREDTPGDIFNFVCWVPKSGFEWTEAQLHKDQRNAASHPDHLTEAIRADLAELHWLVRREHRESIPHHQERRPLKENTGLFLEFAETEPSETAIQEFASRHGWLGLERIVVARDGNEPRHGEPLWLWAREIETMRAVVDLKDAIDRKDDHTLSQWIHRDKNGHGRYERDIYGQRFETPLWANEGHFLGDKKAATAADVFCAAKMLAMGFANERLKDHVHELLLYDQESRDLVRRVQPRNFLGALWHQCARYLTEGAKWRRCKNCNAWFEVSTAGRGRREDAEYHSENCRIAYHQRRRRHAQREARKLHADGIAIEEVAKRLGRDPEMVRRWIKIDEQPRR